MITSAEIQSAETVTIDQGSSVNVGILVKPSDLTEEIDHVLSTIGVIALSSTAQAAISVNKAGYSMGLLNVRVRNNSIPDGTTYRYKFRLRYEAYPSNVYIDTINAIQIMGGVTG